MQALLMSCVIVFSAWSVYSQFVQPQTEPWPDVNWHPSIQTWDNNIISTKPVSWRRLNSEWLSQRYVYLNWTGRDSRAVELLSNYWMPSDTRTSIKVIARIYRVYPEVILCIAYADSSLGRFLKSQHNYGNVGNNDRGLVVSYTNIEQWFNAIGKVLDNQYLSYIMTVEDLSRYHNATGLVYATSNENHAINTLNCLGMIHNKKVPSSFAFRF